MFTSILHSLLERPDDSSEAAAQAVPRKDNISVFDGTDVLQQRAVVMCLQSG